MPLKFDFFPSEKVIFFSASLSKGKPYISMPKRNHESLALVTSGSLLYERQGERYVVRCGEMGYIPRGDTDKSSAYGCDEVSYIAVNFNFAKDESEFFPSLPFPVVAASCDTAKYESLMTKGLSTFISKQKGHELVCHGILLEIIGNLFGEMPENGEKKKKFHRISPAIDMINERFSDSTLRITNLADSCGMSVKNFRRIFFEEKEENPYEYLQKFRIAKAEILLTNTSESVSDIAVMCGFSDLYSFSHAFRKHTGIPPVGYRRTRI